MSLHYKTPDYFAEFSCLGADCPDTCCQKWQIRLDRKHYELLREKLGQDPDERRLFETYIQINDRPVLGDYDYARIRMRADG